jgi:hypothetical protein
VCERDSFTVKADVDSKHRNADIRENINRETIALDVESSDAIDNIKANTQDKNGIYSFFFSLHTHRSNLFILKG